MFESERFALTKASQFPVCEVSVAGGKYTSFSSGTDLDVLTKLVKEIHEPAGKETAAIRVEHKRIYELAAVAQERRARVSMVSKVRVPTVIANAHKQFPEYLLRQFGGKAEELIMRVYRWNEIKFVADQKPVEVKVKCKQGENVLCSLPLVDYDCIKMGDVDMETRETFREALKVLLEGTKARNEVHDSKQSRKEMDFIVEVLSIMNSKGGVDTSDLEI